ncbi:hypothetical protein HXA34_20535 [Salipaludibacillus agaradhaerens]|uniref:hypothetical protein n=1 Tax=Salipaludibacillus agaradhaerens TaxID=76935 RepID=UPI0021513A9A|nr:hypothetical protein [Salipaludibacillus agaradhaerens]MCR6108687.1 hypothetical protein [Salipaludibacillus agaradhaerens]MCR6120710.1 hypothetical protein [Salipaludibacillus agaradhaerens]
MLRILKTRSKLRTVTHHQIEAHLVRKKIPEPLIALSIKFFEDRAGENGELFVGPKTTNSIVEGSWHIPEVELEAIYDKAPAAILHYVAQVTSQPDMAPFNELIRPVETYSTKAQKAYLFLSESALRVVYGIKYDPTFTLELLHNPKGGYIDADSEKRRDAYSAI